VLLPLPQVIPKVPHQVLLLGAKVPPQVLLLGKKVQPKLPHPNCVKTPGWKFVKKNGKEKGCKWFAKKRSSVATKSLVKWKIVPSSAMSARIPVFNCARIVS
jgi:hypothetical protein